MKIDEIPTPSFKHSPHENSPSTSDEFCNKKTRKRVKTNSSKKKMMKNDEFKENRDFNLGQNSSRREGGTKPRGGSSAKRRLSGE